MEPVDDSALLRQFAESHSDEAFAELVTRHVNLVYSVALRQAGQPQNAEEITQAVFIILAKKAAGLHHEKELRAVVLRFYEGRSLREVGLALGASEEAAKKRVGRALEKLRQSFAKRGVGSTTAAIAETISANSVQIAPLALAKTIS